MEIAFMHKSDTFKFSYSGVFFASQDFGL